MRRIAVLLMGASLAGCVTASGEPTLSQRVVGDYQRLALCVHDRWERNSPGTLRLIEYRSDRYTRVVAEEAGGWGPPMAYWEAFFRAAGPNTTAVEIKSAGGIFTIWPPKVMAEVQACAAGRGR